MGYLSFCELLLLVPIFIVTTLLGITTTSLPVISSYGQQSHNLINLSPSTNDHANQNEISDGRQQLIAIPSLSGNDIAIVEEQANGNEDQKNDDNGNEVKYNNNGIPLELPFP